MVSNQTMSTSSTSSTVVIQSFRSHDVPEWIQRCMQTARSWAEQSGFTYKLTGDEFFDVVPQWFRKKAGRYITVLADLARLLLARQALHEGAERVVWIDADVLIFRPTCLTLDPEISYGYSREVWIWKDSSARVKASPKVNNAACMFRNDSLGRGQLEQYIADCESIMEQLECVRDHTVIGTKYLTAKNQQSPLPILRGFGLLSPMMMRAVLHPDPQALRHFLELQGGPIYAANLCNFFRVTANKDSRGMTDTLYSAVVEELMRTEGKILEIEKTSADP